MSAREPNRVLVIDDNQDDRALAIRELKRAFPGVETIEILDAQQFASALEEQSFDAVLTDFQLGWTTGQEVLRTIKSIRPLTPVIMFTATASQEDAVEAMKAGLDDYIVKSPRHYVRLPLALQSALVRADAIRAHREAEERLRRQEAWFTATLECIGEAVITADMNGLVQSLNPQAERMTGWCAAQAVGRDIDEVLRLTDMDGQTLPVSPARVAIGERRSTVEEIRDYCLIRRDGTDLTVIDGASPIYVADQMEGVVIAIRDISERKHMERSLLRSNGDLQQFAYAASHDLQEPLRTIVVFTQLLQKELGGQLTNDQRRYMQFVQDAGRRMSMQIQGLLQYSSQDRDAHLEVFPIRDAVDTAVHDLHAYMQDRNGKVECGSLGIVKASRSQLSIVFQNLISNGLKYNMSPTPTVKIETRDTSEGKLIAVSDNGIGIPAPSREKVFRLFSRLQPDRFSGTGIGLSSARRAVERFGGQLWIDPNSRDGTTFLIRLPD